MCQESKLLAKRLLVDSIWKSARLEGFSTTFPKTEEILDNIPVDTSRDEVLFIVNMKRAWNFLLDNLDLSNNIALLEELNRLVGDNLFYDAGSIRKMPVSIGGTDWVPEQPIRAVIIEELEQILKIKDTEEMALHLFCYVARTQMFIDGNKRVAQLIANKVLIENNIGIFQIPIQAIERFKVLLVDFYETNNSSDIISFMKDYCIKHITGKDKIYKEDSNTSFEEVEVVRNFTLSPTQISILNKILKNIRKLLFNHGYSGRGVLLEQNNIIFLYVNDVLLATLGIETSSILKNNTDISDSTMYQFISGTILLLNKYITFSVKSIHFEVRRYELTMGTFKDSKIEKGSIDLIVE